VAVVAVVGALLTRQPPTTSSAVVVAVVVALDKLPLLDFIMILHEAFWRLL
jgi:hypothetical protein